MDAVDKAKRRKLVDRLLLLCAALLVAVVGVAAFWIVDDYQLNPAWVFAAGAGLVFFLVVGWGYRTKFRSATFVTFFLAWMCLHISVFLLVLAFLGFLYYLPLLVIELWIGYTVAIWFFGPPPSPGLR